MDLPRLARHHLGLHFRTPPATAIAVLAFVLSATAAEACLPWRGGHADPYLHIRHAHLAVRRKKMDADYHFSCQFTADVIAMNHSDFVLTSTLQEIAGTADTMGQCDPLQNPFLPSCFPCC